MAWPRADRSRREAETGVVGGPTRTENGKETIANKAHLNMGGVPHCREGGGDTLSRGIFIKDSSSLCQNGPPYRRLFRFGSSAMRRDTGFSQWNPVFFEGNGERLRAGHSEKLFSKVFRRTVFLFIGDIISYPFNRERSSRSLFNTTKETAAMPHRQCEMKSFPQEIRHQRARPRIS